MIRHVSCILPLELFFEKGRGPPRELFVLASFIDGSILTLRPCEVQLYVPNIYDSV